MVNIPEKSELNIDFSRVFYGAGQSESQSEPEKPDKLWAFNGTIAKACVDAIFNPEKALDTLTREQVDEIRGYFPNLTDKPKVSNEKPALKTPPAPPKSSKKEELHMVNNSSDAIPLPPPSTNPTNVVQFPGNKPDFVLQMKDLSGRTDSIIRDFIPMIKYTRLSDTIRNVCNKIGKSNMMSIVDKHIVRISTYIENFLSEAHSSVMPDSIRLSKEAVLHKYNELFTALEDSDATLTQSSAIVRGVVIEIKDCVLNYTHSFGTIPNEDGHGLDRELATVYADTYNIMMCILGKPYANFKHLLGPNGYTH
jgi:hypothetical protein